jgi:trafficking protein particle complex subunit 9
MFKNSADPVWHAAALEGLATIPVLDAWSSSQVLVSFSDLNYPYIDISFQSSSFSNIKEPWVDIGDKLSQAAALYSKSTPSSDAEHHYSLLAHLYTTSVLRHTAMLLSVWSAKGWGAMAYASMLKPGPNPHLPLTLAHSDHLANVHLERLSSATGIKRSQISEILGQCHGPWLLHLGPRDRVNVLGIVAGYYGCLGYKRKEAYVLREILGCIMDLVVCGREQHEDPHGMSTGSGTQNFSMSSGIPAMVGVRENDSADGNESIMRLVKHVCKVHGIDLEAVKVVDTSVLESPKEDEGSKLNTDVVVLDEELLPMETVGWPELQIGIIREAIAVSEALPGILPFRQPLCLTK